jgi:hypothetical protein
VKIADKSSISSSLVVRAHRESVSAQGAATANGGRPPRQPAGFRPGGRAHLANGTRRTATAGSMPPQPKPASTRVACASLPPPAAGLFRQFFSKVVLSGISLAQVI